ncbi:helix-turn-helix domain-containing protein [Nonomuraea typhae]|uniref:helix-turn-helix domain-containing protein n=1 Tax=Nonomuraea typhae TaxID=2603600 RepID=UPI0012FCCF14|nr:helix-turn-helix domain-containing protein [Nonomuraea typhae]
MNTTVRQGHVREPDTATTLVFRSGWDGTGLLVLGPRTKASYFALGEMPRCVTVRLRPGLAGPLLGVAMSELVDEVVHLREMWGRPAVTLMNHLAAEADDARLAGRLTAELAGRLARASAADTGRARTIQAAAGMLTATAKVPEIARELGVSERHLRNLFHDGVGLSPKLYARIHRVRGVLAGDRGEPWAELAASTGFYDQSHMSADFRSVMGVPPGAFRAGRLPAPGRCAFRP